MDKKKKKNDDDEAFFEEKENDINFDLEADSDPYGEGYD